MAEKNIVQIAIMGIDKITKVIEDIEKNAEKSFEQIGTAVESIPDIDIDTNINTENAKTEFQNIEAAIDNVENSIQSIPDPTIDTTQAQTEIQAIETAVKQADSMIQSMPDVEVDGSKAEQNIKNVANATNVVKNAINTIPDPQINAGQAQNEMKKVESAVNQAENAIRSIPDPNIDASKAANNFKDIEQAAERAKNAVKNMPDPNVDASKAKNELKDLEAQAEKAKDAVDAIEGAIGGLIAGGGIKGAVEKALEVSSIQTKIDVAFNIDPKSEKAVKNAISTVKSYGIEAEDALEGVRRQFALNADASDEANSRIVKGAAAIASAYGEIDFTELIQETNEVASELGIADEEALALVNSLLKVGFPPGELDIIAEYGQQLSRAGFNAQEIQAIMAAGVDTNSWNIDNLLDGLKEGRILLAEFGAEVDEGTKKLLEGTGISASQLQSWGRAVAEGGVKGREAMIQVAKALSNVRDETKRNELGVKIFGTMWEDQGDNIIEALLGAEKATGNLSDEVEQLGQDIKKIDKDPAVQFQKAIEDVNKALSPLYSVIATIVSVIAQWASQNPILVSSIIGIATTLGVVIGSIKAFQVAVNAARTAMSLFNTTMKMNPIGLVITAITTLISILGTLDINWKAIGEFLKNLWNKLGELASEIFPKIGEKISEAWEWIKGKTSEIWDGIKEKTVEIWESIKEFFANIWNSIVEAFNWYFETVKENWDIFWGTIKEVVETIWNGIVEFFSWIWETIVGVFNSYIETVKENWEIFWGTIKEIVETIWNGIVEFFNNIWNGIIEVFNLFVNTIKEGWNLAWTFVRDTVIGIWNGIKEFFVNTWEVIKNIFSTAIDAVKNALTIAWNWIAQTTSSVWNGIKNFFTSIWEGIKTVFTTVTGKVKEIIQTAWNRVKNVTENVFGRIRDFFSGIWDKIVSGVTTMKDKFLGAWNAISNGVKKSVNVLIGLINGAITGIEKMINAVAKAINSIPSFDIPNWVPGIGGGKFGLPKIPTVSLPRVPALAEGGIVTRKTMALIGEGRDHEAVIPLNNNVMAKLGAMIGDNIKGGGDSIDYRKLAEAIADALAKTLLPALNNLSPADIRLIVQEMNVSNDYNIVEISRQLKRLIDKARRGKGEGW